MNKYAYYLVVLFFLVSGLFYRWSSFTTHASFIDDLCPMINLKLESNYDVARLIHDSGSKDYNSNFYKSLRTIERAGLGSFVFPIVNANRKIFAVSYHDSYAPIPFFVTALLLSNDKNFTYQDHMIWARLPSLIIDLIFVLLMITAIKKLCWHNHKHGDYFAIITSFFWSISLSDRIVVSQSTCYNAGMLAVALAIIWIYKRRVSWKTGLFLGFLFAMQYSTLPFIFGLFLFLVKDDLLQLRKTPFYVGCLAIIKKVRIEIVLFLSLYMLVFFEGKVWRFSASAFHNWNHGVKGEFLFPYFLYKMKLLDALLFFPKNTYIIISYFFSDVPLYSFEFNWFYFVLTILLFIGFGVIFGIIKPSKDILNPNVRVYIALASACYIVFVVVGILTYSPTRHSVILLPFFLVAISLGLFYLGDILSKFKAFKWIPLCLVFLSLAYSSYSYMRIYPRVKALYTSPWLSKGFRFVNNETHNRNFLFVSWGKNFYRFNNSLPKAIFVQVAPSYLTGGWGHYLDSNTETESGSPKKAISLFSPKQAIQMINISRSDTVDVVFYNISDNDQRRVLNRIRFKEYKIVKTSSLKQQTPADEVFYSYFEPNMIGGRTETVYLKHYLLVKREASF